MAPITASQQSEIILSSILIFFFEFPTKINFSKLRLLPISQHLFLFTMDANFLSKFPSFSSGYNSNNFFEIISPKTLSPKNSIFHNYFLHYNFYV